MRVVRVVQLGETAKLFALEDTVTSDHAEISRSGYEYPNRAEDQIVLESLLVEGVFYIGTTTLGACKSFDVTLDDGYDWLEVEPRVREAFEALPHIERRFYD